nr:PREDICTED: lysosomal alpha-mannosidase [Tribolium castaneum]|eukprot:XP_008200004.1 PREDICTED: lysosomal alpha-mannosidase [Tribolium castaneum]
MRLQSTPCEKSVKSLVSLVLQMTFAVLLFCVFFALSVEGKPLAEGEPTCGYEACPKVGSDTFNVHLIPHSHDDVGWLKTPDQYYFQDVQNIISSVVDALKQNPERRFVQVETAFFQKWWEQQKPYTREALQKLVNNGQFEFINAAWSMNDEAAVHYQSTIDQFTLGLRYIQDNLGKCARPKVAWQIDPFGHSREQASISAHMGFDSMFFARLDYRDKNRRLDNRSMDLLWRGSANLGNTSDIFTSVLYRHYSAPPNFCFDIVCNDAAINDDPESPDYNLEERVGEFADFVREQAKHYPTNNILVTMGDDFRYEAAMTTYMNLDLLIKGFETFEQKVDDKRIKVLYSTPSCYTKAVHDYVNSNNQALELKTDDFFPYADGPNTYWTGYFTSRPASKHFERQGNNLLQVVKQVAANLQQPYDREEMTELKEAVGVMQHHDAITGTEKQHVAKNYHFLLSRAMKSANDFVGAQLSIFISRDAFDFEFDSCLLANVSSCDKTNSDRFTLVVYNPLSHTTTTTVMLPVYERTSWKITDPDGNSVDYQIDSSLTDFTYVEDATTSANTVQFAAKDLPPHGYKVYQFEATKKEETGKPSPRRVVGYDNASFEISEQTGLLEAVTLNGIRVEVSQDFQYYESQDSSGAYIFVPQGQEAKRIASGPITTTLVTGNVSQGVLQEFGSWARQFIKVYKDDQSFIEFDWIIGPIDISDNVGKEVVTKFTTPLKNNGEFYTDSNGREFIKRTRNHRPDYDYSDEQPVSGNYYPVNNRIAIRDDDQKIELAIITDRSQGGSSLNDGEVELMVHRACQHDDGRGVGENLNEQEFGQGIKVRGKHYLVVGPTSGQEKKSLAAIEREIAQRKTVTPWFFVSNKDATGALNQLQHSGLKSDLPENVHLLTLEPWDDDTVLLRLEHVLEKGEDDNLSKDVTVDLSDLFTFFTINELQETTLGANMLLEENVRMHWPGSSDDGSQKVKDVTDLKVTLPPMEIRTFVAKITYNPL